MGEARRRNKQGLKFLKLKEFEEGLIVEENWERDEREEVVLNSRSEGRRGVRRRPENQPMREVELGIRRRSEAVLIEPEVSWKEEEVRKPVMVARRVGELSSDESSERLSGVTEVTWPKRRPSIEEGEVEKRWIREASVGPEIAIFCNGGSSMTAAHGGESREREGVVAILFYVQESKSRLHRAFRNAQ